MLIMAQVERSCVVISSRFFFFSPLLASPVRALTRPLPGTLTSSCRGTIDPARLSYVDLSSCPCAVAAIWSRTKFSNTFHLSSPAAAKDGSECFLESKSPLLHTTLACSAELSHVGPDSMSCVSQDLFRGMPFPMACCVGLLRHEPAARWIQGRTWLPTLVSLCHHVLRRLSSPVFSSLFNWYSVLPRSFFQLWPSGVRFVTVSFCFLGALPCLLRDRGNCSAASSSG